MDGLRQPKRPIGASSARSRGVQIVAGILLTTSPTIALVVSQPSPPYGDPKTYGMVDDVSLLTTSGRSFS